MPAPYLSFLDLRIMAARAERRLAAAGAAFGETLRWGMEEAAWMTLERDARQPRSPLPTLGEFRERRGMPIRHVAPAELPQCVPMTATR